MENPFKAVGRLWKDPKKRKWLIVGIGATVAVAFIALRRPKDPADQTAEDNAAAQDAPPEPVADPYAPINGALPPVYAYDGGGGDDGGGGGAGDPAFDPMDLSGIQDQLDQLAAGQQDAIDSAVSGERAERRARDKAQKQATQKARAAARQAQRQAAAAKRTTKRLQKRVNRLQRGSGKTAGKSGARPRPAQRGARPRPAQTGRGHPSVRRRAAARRR